jgi:hypothetical protein
LFSKFENLGFALQHAYPEFDWEIDKFTLKSKKAGQRWLRVKIEELLPRVEIIENYLHPDLHWGIIELPIFLS